MTAKSELMGLLERLIDDGPQQPAPKAAKKPRAATKPPAPKPDTKPEATPDDEPDLIDKAVDYLFGDDDD